MSQLPLDTDIVLQNTAEEEKRLLRDRSCGTEQRNSKTVQLYNNVHVTGVFYGPIWNYTKSRCHFPEQTSIYYGATLILGGEVQIIISYFFAITFQF